jgi:simple sugar transport system permease protein
MPGIVLFIILFVLFGGFGIYTYSSVKYAIKNNMESWQMKLWKKDSVKSISSSLISIFVGMTIGAIILVVMGFFPNETFTVTPNQVINGVQLIFFGMFNTGRTSSGLLAFGFNGTSIGNMLFRATPLILTGLSVAVAFKTGLFNIGAPGQYLVGTATTLILALAIPTETVPAFVVWTTFFFPFP